MRRNQVFWRRRRPDRSSSASAICQLSRRRGRLEDHPDALAHRPWQRPRVGLRRHGRGDLWTYLAADHQGIRARHPDLSERLPDLAHSRHHRALFLALALRPAWPPHVACRQYCDVLADDADRSSLAKLYCLCRGARFLPLRSMGSGHWDRCWSPKPGRRICAAE
jgi:hypothetical protein